MHKNARVRHGAADLWRVTQRLKCGGWCTTAQAHATVKWDLLVHACMVRLMNRCPAQRILPRAVRTPCMCSWPCVVRTLALDCSTVMTDLMTSRVGTEPGCLVAALSLATNASSGVIDALVARREGQCPLSAIFT